MDKRALGVVFLRVIQHCPVSMIPQIRISFIYHAVYSKPLTSSITHFSADPGGCAVYDVGLLLLYFWGLRVRTPLRAWMFISCVCVLS